MKRLLRMFDAYLDLEKRVDEKNFEVVFLRDRIEKLEKQLVETIAEHKRDLRKVADTEAHRFSGRRVFSEASDEPAVDVEQVRLPQMRLKARANVQMANERFKEQIRQASMA